MKKAFLILFSTLLTVHAFAQDPEDEAIEAAREAVDNDALEDTFWNYQGLFKLTGTNVGLFNWAAGGQNTIAINGGISLSAKYARGRRSWDNFLDLNYGVITQSRDMNDWFKNDDRIEFNSKYGYKANKDSDWFYTALLNFRSQFAPGYASLADTNKISDFMSPGYLLFALGMDYKPNKNFSMFVSPLTVKATYVLDDELANAGAFGVEKAKYAIDGSILVPGEHSRYEIGGYFKMTYQDKFSDDKILFRTSVDLFSNYLENPENIDVNWTTESSYQINKYLGMSLATVLIYDDDIDVPVYNGDDEQIGVGPRTQFKYTFGVGLTYAIK